jgi:(R,R)-butanediol dehydrogenase/meso-butanediol dehydrogenase/diacetyl reductase
MKAVAFVERGKMELREVAEADPKPGEVRLAVTYCGVCGSDVHEYETGTMSPRSAGIFQPIMGHEFTAKVVAAGEGVTGFAPCAGSVRWARATAARAPTPKASPYARRPW